MRFEADTAVRLAVRFAPEAGESLRGYLLRLAEANGYPGLSWLAQKVWRSQHVGSLGPQEAAALGALVDLGPGIADTLGPAATKGGWVGSDANQKAPRNLVNRTQPKVCPACLAERKVLRAVWEIRFWLVCPTHGCGMLDACPRCRRPLGWDRSRVDRCCEAAPLAEHRAPPAPAAAIDLARLFARAVGLPAPAPSVPLRELAGHLDFEALSRLAAHLGTLGAGKGTGGSASCAAVHASSPFHRTSEMLSGWPHGLHKAIDASRDAEAARGRASFALEFPELHYVLKYHLADEAFSFVRQAAVSHVHARHPGSMLRHGPSPSAELRGSLVPVREVVRVFGVGGRTVVAHAQRGAFRALCRSKGTRRRWLVDLDDFGKFVREQGLVQRPRGGSRATERHINMSRIQAGHALGIDRQALERLRVSGILGAPVVGAGGRPIVRKEAVEALLAEFDARAAQGQQAGAATRGRPTEGGPPHRHAAGDLGPSLGDGAPAGRDRRIRTGLGEVPVRPFRLARHPRPRSETGCGRLTSRLRFSLRMRASSARLAARPAAPWAGKRALRVAR